MSDPTGRHPADLCACEHVRNQHLGYGQARCNMPGCPCQAQTSSKSS